MPYDGPYADLMDKLGFIPANHAAPQFFPVAARRLFDEKGEELPGYRRIVREDTGDTLHVATDSYQLVTNEEAFGAFEQALGQSSLDLTDMQIGTDYAAAGARVFRQYLLPAHQVEVKAGVAVALRLLMLNSYDGSLRFRGQVGAYNFVCANTSISGTDYGSFALRHSGGIDVPKAIAGLTRAAEEHIETAKRWRAWPKIKLSDQQVIAIVSELPLATESLVDHLMHEWVKNRDADSPQNGPNLWTLYNTLTAWATHSDIITRGNRPSGIGQLRYDRERRVAKLVESPRWAKVAA